jgi:anti-anti-sigma factor
MSDKRILTIAPRGRLDAAGALPLETELKQHIAEGQVHLLIDLAETRYVSSNGMRVLLAVLKQAKRRGGALKLCRLNARVHEIFEMAGFDRVFEIFETREQAEKSFE